MNGGGEVRGERMPDKSKKGGEIIEEKVSEVSSYNNS